MPTSARSGYLHCSRTTSPTSRTAVYGPVRTVVWQGSAGDCRPYADQVGLSDRCFSVFDWEMTGTQQEPGHDGRNWPGSGGLSLRLD